DTLNKAGNSAQAQALYEQIISRWPNDVVAHNGLADTLNKAGNSAQAQALYEQIISRWPDDQVALHGLANLHRQQGRMDEALALLTEPETVTTLQQCYDLHLIGMIRFGQNKLDEAERIFNKGAALAPIPKEQALFQKGLSLVLLKKGDIEQAEERLIALPPEYATQPDARVICIFTRVRLEQADIARKAYQKLMKNVGQMNPQTKAALTVIAEKYRLDQPNAALPKLDQASNDEIIAKLVEMELAA
ncbi:MAG: tetratricopeptide repeat protein, partial [Magnetococcales bacterium]|nr:tetratricopeptide repeat protein [Magnetococcales bacterium]